MLRRLLVMTAFAAMAFGQTQTDQAAKQTQTLRLAPQMAPSMRSHLTPAQIARLAATIQQLTSQGEAARGFWGIEMVSLADGRVLYEQNPDRLFTPASNVKLFSTISALTLLGPEYKMKTTVETAGSVGKDGVVKGDIVLMGRGDPNLSGRTVPYAYSAHDAPPLRWLEELADQVAGKGVREVRGNVIGDDTAFAWERYGEGWSQDDLMWDYGAPVSALTFNDNVQSLTITPGAKMGDKAVLRFDPDVSYYEIDNRLTTAAAASGPRKIAMDRQPGSRTLVLWGTVPQEDTGTTEQVAIEDPAEFAAVAFKKLLEARGIRTSGAAKSRHQLMAEVIAKPDAAAAGSTAVATKAATAPLEFATPGQVIPQAGNPPPATPQTVLAEHESEPLAQDVVVTNKVSQNLHAEIALRLLGKEKGLAPTVEESLKAEKQVLDAAGILPQEYALFDGSGLSRQDLVSPRAVVKLLRFAQAQLWAESFNASLPIAGVDGTLDERMKKSIAQGRIVAKTGSLGHVNAISGFATTLGGERIVFSILVNNHKLTGHGGTAIIDKILEALVGMDAR